MEKLLELLSDRFIRHQRWVAAGIVAFTLAAIFGNSRLQFDDAPRDVFRTHDKEFLQLEQLFADFGSDDNDCLLLVETDSLFTSKTMAQLRGLTDEIGRIQGIASVHSLLDVVVFEPGQPPAPLIPATGAPQQAFDTARRRALKHPLVAGQVLSDDGRSALVIARLAGESIEVDKIDPIVEKLHEISERFSTHGGLSVGVTGVPPMRMEIFQMVRRESNRFIVIGSVLGFTMALILFRRFWAVMIVASAPMLGAFWTLGALGLVGEQLNVINTVLPTLVMVVGFTDAVHLMVDIRHSRMSGHSPLRSARTALFHLAVACALTSLTTAIGFGSLAVARVDVIRRFGLSCSAGALLAFLSVITVVPLLSSTRLGLWVQQAHEQDFFHRHLKWFEGLIDTVVRHAKTVAVLGTIITLLLGLSVRWLRPDNRLTEYIPHHNESFQVMERIDREFGGMMTASVVLHWDKSHQLASPEVIQAIEDVQSMFADELLMHHPLSVINLLESMPAWLGNLPARTAFISQLPPDLVHRLVRPDLRRALVTVRLRDLGTAVYQPVFQAFDADLRKLGRRHPGIDMHLTGTVVVASRNINQMIVDLAKSLGLAAIVIFTVMSLVFRSLRLGLISVLPNAFPMVVTAAVLVLSGRPLQLTSVIVFSICLGIAVDDTIHFLTRFRRELHYDWDTPAAIRRTFIRVGSALITTTIVLVAGFGSVLISELPSSRLFGWLSCTAIASALMGDLIILPALLACFVKPWHLRVPKPVVPPQEDRVDLPEQTVVG